MRECYVNHPAPCGHYRCEHQECECGAGLTEEGLCDLCDDVTDALRNAADAVALEGRK